MRSSRARRILALALSAAASPFAFAGENDAWTSSGPPGASVYTFAAATSSPGTVYVGTGRGVWKGERGGSAWTSASHGFPVARVQSIAVDPLDTNTLYAGTITPAGVESLGLFKSTDGGASWSDANTGLSDPFTQLDPLDVSALSIDPSNSQVLIAGTRFSEIFRSLDGGATWEAQTSGGFQLGLETTGFARDPSDPQRIYAASTIGLLLTVDGGGSWGFFGDAGVSFFCVAVDPSAPSVVWAGNFDGVGLGRSADSGATWEAANGDLPHATVNGIDVFPPIEAVAVAPDGSAVYVATPIGVFRSTNGGTNWTALEAGLFEETFHSLAFVPGQPPTTLLAGGNGGGVYRSEDAGTSWAKSSLGLNEALVSSVVANPIIPGEAFASAWDGVYATDDGGQSWDRVSGGLPPVPVASLALRYAVSLLPGDLETLFAGTRGAGLWSSEDRGESWGRRVGLDDDYVSAVLVDPNNIQTVYAGTDHPYNGSNPQRVYKSTDGGETWQATGLDPGGFGIDALAVDPDDSSRVAAVSRGLDSFFQSANGGIAWTTVTPASGCGGILTLLYENNGNGILLGATNGICRSADGGATWTPQTLAPLSFVEDLVADPDDASVIWAGASPAVPGGTGGVFRSPDGGITWTPFGAGLSTYSVRSVAVDASGDPLYAGILRGGVAVLAPGEPTRDAPQPPAAPDRDTRVIERP